MRWVGCIGDGHWFVRPDVLERPFPTMLLLFHPAWRLSSVTPVESARIRLQATYASKARCPRNMSDGRHAAKSAQV